ncbi:hypothetical protein RHGRI_006195 [Rhododendron griersonianum]|uniref:No apical meristem-associated C-terminal domain-containing protein n=1 Tax=Rhododendron griersonianum TaxID=479676 RepID=A0AAV6KS37_9ERIC|nr:hypothetical protein RHGRI_006195 [Rhododendron griersonianum]
MTSQSPKTPSQQTSSTLGDLVVRYSSSFALAWHYSSRLWQFLLPLSVSLAFSDDSSPFSRPTVLYFSQFPSFSHLYFNKQMHCWLVCNGRLATRDRTAKVCNGRPATRDRTVDWQNCGWMDAPKNAYFTNLLQDGLILEDELSMEPQDEVGFTYKGEKERLKKRKKAEISTSPLAGILTDIKEEQKKASDKKMDIIQQLNVQEQERLQLEKEKLRQGEEKISIKQKMLRVEEMKEEERIMLVDTSVLPHVQQEYYQSRQREILQQREKRI